MRNYGRHFFLNQFFILLTNISTYRVKVSRLEYCTEFWSANENFVICTYLMPFYDDI